MMALLVANTEAGLLAAIRVALLATLMATALGATASAQPAVQLSVPDSVEIGSRFAVNLGQVLARGDYVTLVDADAPPNTIGPHFRTAINPVGYLVAPPQPGLYEVRYLTGAGRSVAGSILLEVVDAAVAVTAPASVSAGAPVLVTWNAVIAPEDFVTIVPADAPPSTLGLGVEVRANRSATLIAPTEVGDYEARYVLKAGPRALGAAAITVIEPTVELTAPGSALPGQGILVAWSEPINPNDLVTIVPADAPPERIAEALEVRGRRSVTMELPSTPGAYEVRYILGGTRRPIGRAPVNVGEIAVDLSAPAAAVAGQQILVSWSHAASPGDAVTIVPADAPAGKIGQHFRVGHLRSGALPVPRAPGAYEVRYVSQGEALARLPVAVTQPSVTLTGPETAEPGTRFEVAWDTVVGPNDVLTLVPAAAPETQIAATIGVSRNGTAVLQAPLGAGAYEVRYILSPDGRVLARWPFTVMTANQPASGADRTGQITLTVPERAGAGETIAVGWDGPSGQRDRLAIASPDQPATRWLRAIAAGEGGRADVALPDQAGSYEIRYIDLQNRQILATAPIVVE